MQEYYELFKNEPIELTRFKAATRGMNIPAWYHFAVEHHKLEKMAKAGLLDGRSWHIRVWTIHEEATNLNDDDKKHDRGTLH